MPARDVDLFDVKADALAALAAMGAPAERLQSTADELPGWYHPGRAGLLRLGPKVLGAFGELHPAVLEALDARAPMAGFEVLLDAVPEPRSAHAKPPPLLSIFQPVERDFAFVVDRDLPAETLLRAARGADRELAAEIRLFDVYEGAGLPEGKKSLAITVVLQPQQRTLTDAEIEAFSAKLVARVEKATGGSLRRWSQGPNSEDIIRGTGQGCQCCLGYRLVTRQAIDLGGHPRRTGQWLRSLTNTSTW